MSTYGVAIYGVDEYSSDILPLQGITQLYVGSEPTDGREANGVFDEPQLFFEEKSDEKIQAIFEATEPSVYTTSHQLLAHFDNNLDGGNLHVDGLQVEYWRIYRKLSTDTQYKYIKTVPNNMDIDYSEMLDYECANNTLYDYAIEGITSDGQVTNKYEVTSVSLDFYGSWLVDTDTGEIFQFYYELSDDQLTLNVGRTEFETFSRYPTVVRSETNYIRSAIEAWIIDKDKDPMNIYTQSVHKEIERLKTFEGRNNLILKFDFGGLYKVDIYNITPTYFRKQTDNNVADVRFEWVEVGEVVQ